jgi:hypothetical protein
MKTKLNDNIIEVMASVGYLKKDAREVGLTASFIPIAGIIEFLNDRNQQVGVSFDGETIKVKDKFYPIDKYFSTLKAADAVLCNFKPFTNFKTQ